MGWVSQCVHLFGSTSNPSIHSPIRPTHPNMRPPAAPPHPLLLVLQPPHVLLDRLAQRRQAWAALELLFKGWLVGRWACELGGLMVVHGLSVGLMVGLMVGGLNCWF